MIKQFLMILCVMYSLSSCFHVFATEIKIIVNNQFGYEIFVEILLPDAESEIRSKLLPGTTELRYSLDVKKDGRSLNLNFISADKGESEQGCLINFTLDKSKQLFNVNTMDWLFKCEATINNPLTASISIEVNR